jgi:hypothetical protein
MRIMLIVNDTGAQGVYEFARIPRVREVIDLDEAVAVEGGNGAGIGMWSVIRGVHAIGREAADHRIFVLVVRCDPAKPGDILHA